MIKFFLNTINKINSDFKENIVKTAIVFVILATVYLLTENIFLSFIVGSAVAILLLNWDSRFFIGIGLIFLISCPVLLTLGKKAVAEEMAVNAYYMLALGVVLQIFQYFKERIILKNKPAEINNPGPMGFSSHKKILVYTTTTVFLISFVFGACLSFFYSNMENKLDKNNKLISSLIDISSENNAQIAGKSTDKQAGLTQEDPKTEKIDPKSIKVSVENTTEQKGLDLEIADECKKMGFLNVNIFKSNGSLNQGTLVQYCTNCLDIAQELVSALNTQTDLLIIEKPELVGEIIIRLGSDQIITDEQ